MAQSNDRDRRERLDESVTPKPFSREDKAESNEKPDDPPVLKNRDTALNNRQDKPDSLTKE